MRIREATSQDHLAIRQVHLDAFGQTEGPVVAQLAIDLLTDDTARPLLALVAEQAATIAGSIIFSSVKVQGCDRVRAYILAPLAIAPPFQRQGMGRALIDHGMQLLTERGADLVLVLGDPAYYTKYGFGPRHHVAPPYQLEYPEAWLARELKPGTLAVANGLAICAKSLNSPEYW